MTDAKVRSYGSAQVLPSEQRVEEICRALDAPHRLEFLLELWRAGVEATANGDFFPLIKLIADWEATTEILADQELAKSIQEERESPEEEKGRSWDEIRRELPIG